MRRPDRCLGRGGAGATHAPVVANGRAALAGLCSTRMARTASTTIWTLQRFGAFGGAQPGRELHADADQALKAASVCKCPRPGFGAGGALSVALPNCELFTVLNTAQLQQALQAVKTRALAAGEPLLLPHTTQRLALLAVLAVLAAASVTVMGPAAAQGLRRRRQSLRPGMALGAAQLPGAEAHANVSSQPHQPDTEALAALRRDKAAPLTQPVQPSCAASLHYRPGLGRRRAPIAVAACPVNPAARRRPRPGWKTSRKPARCCS